MKPQAPLSFVMRSQSERSFVITLPNTLRLRNVSQACGTKLAVVNVAAA
jgi:hypothetical protein